MIAQETITTQAAFTENQRVWVHAFGKLQCGRIDDRSWFNGNQWSVAVKDVHGYTVYNYFDADEIYLSRDEAAEAVQ